jgi:uncharacterized protein (UPF0147 family)
LYACVNLHIRYTKQMNPVDTNKLYIFIDESGTSDGSPFLYMSAVVTNSPHAIRSSCESLIQKIEHDPELSQNIKSVRENGIKCLHYVDDHPEIRTAVINLLPSLNFDGYIIFARKSELDKSLSKVELLKLLLENLLRSRLLEKHYAEIEIVYEKFDDGSAVTEAEFAREIATLCKELSGEFGKEIKTVSISFNNKSELCLGIPDYLCGIVSAYFSLQLSGESVEDSWQERNYYRVAGKIRVIHDLNRKKFYSRKDPLDIESIQS